MAQPVDVETTVPPKFKGTTARAFAEGFVARRLAACVHLVPIESSYWWKGRQESAKEVLLRFKTSSAVAPQLEEALRAEHPYEVPYVARFGLDVRALAYERWLLAEAKVSRTARAARAR
jgi:periplasmic divalent cation tolerance protein